MTIPRSHGYFDLSPKAVIFDNGASFKGRLLVAFCQNAGIRLIHSAVFHPQTNGKLERAFRDDMKDFYRQYDAWILAPLRRDLPGYVHYRNWLPRRIGKIMPVLIKNDMVEATARLHGGVCDVILFTRDTP